MTPRIRPSEVYHLCSREVAIATARRAGYKVVGFRTPMVGEMFLLAPNGALVETWRDVHTRVLRDAPRLILEPLR